MPFPEPGPPRTKKQIGLSALVILRSSAAMKLATSVGLAVIVVLRTVSIISATLCSVNQARTCVAGGR